MKKNVIIFHLTDRGACSWVRFRFMAGLLETNTGGELVPVISPWEVTEPDVLQRTAAVVVSRPMIGLHGELLEHYKAKRAQYGYKVFADYDDLLCDIDGKSPIPEYNSFRISPFEIGNVMDCCCAGLDGITVASEYLASTLRRRFGWDNVTVVPNTVPKFVYGMAPRTSVEGYIEKPVVLYAGSMTHFKDGHHGDFEGPWVPWMRESAKNGEIDLHCFGHSEPDFLEGVPVTVHPYVPAVAFPAAIAAIRPDIYLAPLQENEFNKCKSDLKLLEAAAVGAVLLGSDFDDSPYSKAHGLSKVWSGCSVEGLGLVVETLCQKDNFNSVLRHQREYMQKGGRYTESRESIMRFLGAYMGDAVSCI